MTNLILLCSKTLKTRGWRNVEMANIGESNSLPSQRMITCIGRRALVAQQLGAGVVEPHSRCTSSLAQTNLGSSVHGPRTVTHHRCRRSRQHRGGAPKVPHHHWLQGLYCA